MVGATSGLGFGLQYEREKSGGQFGLMPDSCNSAKGDLNLSSTVVVNTRDNMLPVRSNNLLLIILHLKPVFVVSVFLHTRTILTCLGTSSVASFFSTFNEREGNSIKCLALNCRFIKTLQLIHV